MPPVRLLQVVSVTVGLMPLVRAVWLSCQASVALVKLTWQGGESQAQPKLQRLVATLRKRHQEEVEARAREDGAEWQTEVTQVKKRVRTARRAVEEENERIYQNVVAEHERYMERAVLYKSLRYIRELSEAGKPQEIRAVTLQCGRVTGNKKEMPEEVAQSFRRQHNQGQQELSVITRRMVRGYGGCSRRSRARTYTAAG